MKNLILSLTLLLTLATACSRAQSNAALSVRKSDGHIEGPTSFTIASFKTANGIQQAYSILDVFGGNTLGTYNLNQLTLTLAGLSTTPLDAGNLNAGSIPTARYHTNLQMVITNTGGPLDLSGLEVVVDGFGTFGAVNLGVSGPVAYNANLSGAQTQVDIWTVKGVGTYTGGLIEANDNDNKVTIGDVGTSLNGTLVEVDDADQEVTIKAANGTIFNSPKGFSTQHIEGRGTAPSLTMGAGAGSSPTSTSVVGSDAAGIVSFTTGSSPTGSGTVFTITYNQQYSATPKVIISPCNANAGLLVPPKVPYVLHTSSDQTAFLVQAGSTPLTASTAYQFYYHVIK